MCAVVCVLVAPLPSLREARAQSSADLNRAAGLLFEKGDFAAASRLLKVVLQLTPSAKAHRNLALCFAKMSGHEDEAVMHMQAYLRARPNARDKEQAERLIAEMDDRLAQRGSDAFLESVPSGAAIYLDDGTTPLGTAPLRARLPLGEHWLRFELKGFESVRRKVQLAKRQTLRVAIALTPAHQDGAIVVRADRLDARVTIDGRAAQIGRNVVMPGAHQVRVSAADTKAWEAEIHVAPGGAAEVVARLIAHAPPERARPFRVWRWVGVGVTALGTLTAIIGYTRAVMDRNRAAGFDGQSFSTLEQLRAAVAREQRSAINNSTLANAGLATALVAGAATTTFFVLDALRERGTPSSRAAPVSTIVPIAGGAAVSFAWRY